MLVRFYFSSHQSKNGTLDNGICLPRIFGESQSIIWNSARGWNSFQISILTSNKEDSHVCVNEIGSEDLFSWWIATEREQWMAVTASAAHGSVLGSDFWTHRISVKDGDAEKVVLVEYMDDVVALVAYRTVDQIQIKLQLKTG